MMISLPVHIPAGEYPDGRAVVVLVANQLSVPGLYLPPVFKSPKPPQMIISLPVQTAVWPYRPEGESLVATHVSVLGLYLPPVLKKAGLPPQTIISVPVQTAV